MAQITLEIPDKCIDSLEDIALHQKCSGVSDFLAKEAVSLANDYLQSVEWDNAMRNGSEEDDDHV